MLLDNTASLSVVQNVGVTIWSLAAATILARIGRRWGVVVIAIATGIMTGLNIIAPISWTGLVCTACLVGGNCALG